MTAFEQVPAPLPPLPAPHCGTQLPPHADADFRGSLAAIRRAAEKARQRAAQTGTDLIVERCGQVVRVPQPPDVAS